MDSSTLSTTLTIGANICLSLLIPINFILNYINKLNGEEGKRMDSKFLSRAVRRIIKITQGLITMCEWLCAACAGFLAVTPVGEFVGYGLIPFPAESR